jgi:rod shape-determining protein MreB and related proteins
MGTANTVVCHPARGIVLNEPSVMAVTGNIGREPAAVGSAAKELIGRTSDGILTVHPVRDGVVTDLEAGRTFMIAMLSQVTRMPWERVRPKAVLGIPTGATALERRALIEVADEAGVGRVSLIPQPVAGAMGSGIDPMSRRAHMVVDVGGGTAEAAAFCFGNVLTSRSCRIAGDEMTSALLQYLRQEHQMSVGELTAEDLKLHLCGDVRGSLVVEGRDAITGRPRLVTLRAEDVSEALRPTSESIVQVLAECLDELPPQAVGDVMQDGVLAIGGTVLLPGFTELLEYAFGFPVRIAERPMTCVAEGAAACLRRPEVIRSFGATS